LLVLPVNEPSTADLVEIFVEECNQNTVVMFLMKKLGNFYTKFSPKQDSPILNQLKLGASNSVC